MLQEVRARIAAARASKPRTVLQKPQPLLMEVGDVIVYGDLGGSAFNPYFASKELNKQYTKTGPTPWPQDGWAAMVMVDCGRAFDFLSWYRRLTIAAARSERPALDSLRGEVSRNRP